LQQDFFRSALKQGRQYPVSAFVFGDAQDPTTSRRLLDLLLQHRIQVYPLTESVELQGERYAPGTAWVVPSAQPQFRLVHSIFEATPPVKGSVYGSTSYAVAPAYGLSVGRAKRVPAHGTDALAALPPPTQAGVIGGAAGYAYAFDWRDAAAPALLYRLLDLGLRVRVAGRPFSIDSSAGVRDFGYGAAVVPVAGQTLSPEALHQAIDAAARQAGMGVVGLATGHSRSGIDLGSDGFRPVRKPRVALVMGTGVNAAEIGSVWFLLDGLQWPATRLDPAQLGTVDLGGYTSLVLAGGQYDDLPPRTLERLRHWVDAGGSLIAYGSAAKWAGAQRLAPFQPKAGSAKPSVAEPEDGPKEEARRDFAERQDVLSEQRLSGNMVSARVDISHPLAYGLPRQAIHVNRESNLRLPAPADAFSSVVRVDARPEINGYLSSENRGKFAGALWAAVYAGGKGNVVLFADDPAHRKYWHGTERLLVNALFFADLLAPPPPRG